MVRPPCGRSGRERARGVGSPPRSRAPSRDRPGHRRATISRAHDAAPSRATRDPARGVRLESRPPRRHVRNNRIRAHPVGKALANLGTDTFVLAPAIDDGRRIGALDLETLGNSGRPPRIRMTRRPLESALVCSCQRSRMVAVGPISRSWRRLSFSTPSRAPHGDRGGRPTR